MMQKNTNKKIAPIVCAVAVVLLVLGYIGIFAWALLVEGGGIGFAIVPVVIYTVVMCAVIVGVLAALRQRLKEIEGGEEEDAKKY